MAASGVRRIALRLVCVALAALVLFEATARLLLFAGVADGLELAQALRRPRRLAHPNVEDLYWILQRDLDPTPHSTAGDHDPRLGWLGANMTPGEVRHVQESLVGERRPVLLYGDSFARCVTPLGTCFEDFLEQSELGATHRLLNHAVVGYGFDQSVLMFEATAGHFADRDPVAVVGVFVDDDLDRCALTVRGRTKPRFRMDGGVDEAQPERPGRPFFTSYGLRLLLHSGPLERSWLHAHLCPHDALDLENRERCQAVVAHLADVIERSGVETFVLLFNGRASLDNPGGTGWREPFLREELDAHGISWVATRGPLLAHARDTGRDSRAYFLRDGHPNALGNQVAFRALRDGLAARFGERRKHAWTAEELRGPLSPASIQEVVLGGPSAGARYEFGVRPPFEDLADRSRICIRSAGPRPTEVHYDLAGRATSFETAVRFIPMKGLGPGEGSVGLTLLGDGEELFRTVLRRGEGPLEVRVGLAGVEAFTIRVDGAGDGKMGDYLVLSAPAFL
jgi:hypothetical protein